ncbi:MAG: hypothetical protein M3410_04420, partial [Acidobacteriota bacterium]|nr:hypothetical protein [Acidobacteriota bacterium]
MICKSATSCTSLHLILFTLLLFFPTLVAAQELESSQYDRGTPPQHAAGVSSMGSYISADLGTINLSNGSLNFAIPLGQVGGRGFSLPVTLNYSSKVWSSFIGTDVVTDPVYQTHPAAIAVYDSAEGAPDIYQRVAQGWTLGAVPLLRVKGVGISWVDNPSCGATDYLKALTKLTLILPDKGEVELRDDYTDGSPLGALQMPTSNCRWMDGNRGQRWHATDGSGIVFVSDSPNGVVNGDLNGWLITSDGMRYRFFDDLPSSVFGSVHLNEFARATSVTDRNGNRVMIGYSTNPRAVTYTDQLGRATTIEYNVTDPSSGELLLVRVTVPGYAGQSRQYKIKSGVMNQNYRSGVNPTLPVYNGWTPGLSGQCGTNLAGTELFASSCGGVERIDNWPVLTQVVLPDNRALKFRYNEYGEVAEVEMPTGGKVQYDYAYDPNDGLPSGNSAVFEVVGPPGNVRSIDRAVVARHTYPDGVNVEAHWSYDYSATRGTNGSATNGVTEVIARASDNLTVKLRQKHYFLDAARFVSQTAGGTGYSLWSTGLERRNETLNAAGSSVISAGEQDWSQRTPVVWSFGYTSEQIQNDNRVNEERKILDTGQTARTAMLYDQFNNPTETSEFDFDSTLKRRTGTSYSSTNLVNGVNYADDSIRLLRLPLQQSVYDGVSVEQARTISEYDVYTDDGNHYYLESYGAGPGSIAGHDTANYGAGKTTRGNVTRVGSWIKSSDTYLYAYPRYDILGNVVKAKDARGNISTISFADDFGDGSNPGSGTNNPATPTYALPTLITSPPPNVGEQPHTARSQYDFPTGLLTGFKDRNNIVTQTIYNDPFNRPTLVKSALGVSGVENRTSIYYAPMTEFGITLGKNDVLTAKDQTTLGDATLRSWTVTDGFGRTKEAWSRDPQGDLKVVTNYDPLGRVSQTSNPFRPSLGETAIYTTTVYDLAGRVLTVTTPDNSVVTTSYNGNTVTVTDQIGKQRRSITDALGRLSRVDEPDGSNNLGSISAPVQPTSYGYDVLDNLTMVTQGSQQRYFMYDSLKRLIRARNPEQEVYAGLSLSDPLTGNSEWSMGYSYDNNGNLATKTDARSLISTYVYDALNRNTTVNYSDTAINPDITRVYDTATNGKGRLRESYHEGNQTFGAVVELTKIQSYDALGRPLDQRQSFKTNGVWSAEYQTQRAYNLAGAVTSQVYPSGRTVNYAYDNAGRTENFAGNLGDGVLRTYSTGILYSSLGGMAKEQFGTDTPVYNKSFYNSRGQLSEIRVSTSYTGPTDTTWNRGAIINHYSSQCWGACNGSDNNGNLKQQDHWIPDSSGGVQALFVQSYSYDNLNRLDRVQEGSWQQEFVYDRWGNRAIHQTNTWGLGINNKDFTVNTAHNRLGVPAGQSGTMTYDNAGNLTTDTYTGAGSRTYDAENRMTQAWGGNNQQQLYSYNADGQRTRRKIDGVETWQIYGMDGDLLAEYVANAAAASPQKEYGYRNGQLLVTAEAPTGQAPLTEQNVTWTNVSPTIQVNGNSIQKVSGTSSWYDAGAVSSQAILAGDGYMEFTPGEINTWRMCGLGNADGDAGFEDIDYAFFLVGGGSLA